MTKLFYLSEIVKFAIEKEKESIALYKELSEKVSNNNMKDLFHQLMLDEEKHEDFYVNLLKTVPQEQSPGVKENEEYDAYMQELIFTSRAVPHLRLENLTDIKSALDYAAAREKDSIVFYVGLKNYLPEHNKEKIDPIINEESRHMAKLLFLKKHM
ncbi:MAG: rubrerythrin [uncultured bacterium]|nr:MAG: rubrerythrin [uncultured bacterium]